MFRGQPDPGEDPAQRAASVESVAPSEAKVEEIKPNTFAAEAAKSADVFKGGDR